MRVVPATWMAGTHGYDAPTLFAFRDVKNCRHTYIVTFNSHSTFIDEGSEMMFAVFFHGEFESVLAFLLLRSLACSRIVNSFLQGGDRIRLTQSDVVEDLKRN